MTAYYNEIDEYAAQWLENLITKNLIAPGDVDRRSIKEVKPDDLKGYTQCHFFAGIGGWSYALRLAGWDDSRPVWTGSCPCQPFSSAGKKAAQSDERHLWPHWFRIIRESKPPIIFGEQVAAAFAHGWWDDVAADLEAEGYACAAAVLPACSVGQPHKRDRIWFVGNSEHNGRNRGSLTGSNQAAVSDDEEGKVSASQSEGASEPGNVADTTSQRCRETRECFSRPEEWIVCPDGRKRPVKSGIRLLANGVPARVGKLRAYGNAIVPQVAAEFIKATM